MKFDSSNFLFATQRTFCRSCTSQPIGAEKEGHVDGRNLTKIGITTRRHYTCLKTNSVITRARRWIIPGCLESQKKLAFNDDKERVGESWAGFRDRVYKELTGFNHRLVHDYKKAVEETDGFPLPPDYSKKRDPRVLVRRTFLNSGRDAVRTRFPSMKNP